MGQARAVFLNLRATESIVNEQRYVSPCRAVVFRMEGTVPELVQSVHDSQTKAVIAVAGAGNDAILLLLDVAGASRTVLEIVVPYSSSSFADFIGHEPDQFVSVEAARGLAKAAYRRALVLREGHDRVAGIACTATIATDRPKRGDHRCHIASWMGEAVRVHSLTFVKGLRDRTGEDGIASAIVLNTLAEASELKGRLNLELDSSEQVLIDAAIYEDPVAALLAGHVESAVVYPDGGMIADGQVRGGVLPGSFNPLHQGHELLADAAAELLGADVAYELSVTNVDKPPLEEAEVRRRAAQFAGKRPLMLTSVPVFYEKARVLRDCTFILGWDTAVRLVDPRYYGGSRARMLMALEEMGQLGCSFLVAGRLDDGTFRTMDDVDFPDGVRHLFSSIPESRFRSDASSTELRMADHAG